MKKKLFTLLLITSFSFTALGQTIAVNNEDSSIRWLAKKVTGQHEGNISIVEGNLVIQNNTLTGGNFEVDMNSLIVTDLTGEYKDKLEGHLKSDDFFGVAKFPKANLEIIKTTQKMDNHYEIIADLTIKGITNSITFDMQIENKTAISKLTIDRTKFDIRYGSNSFFDNLGDKTIYDNFEIDVMLKF